MFTHLCVCLLSLALMKNMVISATHEETIYDSQGISRVIPESGISFEPLTSINEGFYNWIQVINIPIVCLTSGASATVKESLEKGYKSLLSITNITRTYHDEIPYGPDDNHQKAVVQDMLDELERLTSTVEKKMILLIDEMDRQEQNHKSLWNLADRPVCATKHKTSPSAPILQDTVNLVDDFDDLRLRNHRSPIIGHDQGAIPSVSQPRRKRDDTYNFHAGSNYNNNHYSINYNHPVVYPNSLDTDISTTERPNTRYNSRYVDPHPRTDYNTISRKVAENPADKIKPEVNLNDRKIEATTKRIPSVSELFNVANMFGDEPVISTKPMLPSSSQSYPLSSYKCDLMNDLSLRCHIFSERNCTEMFMSLLNRQQVQHQRFKRSDYNQPESEQNQNQQEYDAKDWSNDRSKRGLMDFIGKLYNFLYGTATQEQIDELIKAIELTQQGIEINQQSINDTQRALYNISTYLDKKIDRSINESKRLMTEMANEINIIHQADKTLNQMTNRALNLSMISIIATTAGTRASRFSVMLDNCIREFNDINNRFLSYRQMLLSRRLSIDIVSLEDAETIKHYILEHMPKNAEIPTEFSVVDWFSTKQSFSGTFNGNVYVVLKIPLTYPQQKISAYKIQSVPFLSNKVWLQMPFNDLVIMKKGGFQSWGYMQFIDYLNCYYSPYRTCTSTIPWRSYGSGSCLEQLMSLPSRIPDSCSLIILENKPQILPIIKPVWPNAWLISLERNNSLLSYQCEQVGSQVNIAHEQFIPQQAVIKIDKGCTVEIDKTLLKSPYVHNIRSTITMSVLPAGTTELNLTDLVEVFPIGRNFSEFSMKELEVNSKKFQVKMEFPQSQQFVQRELERLQFNQEERDKNMSKIKQELNETLTNLTDAYNWDLYFKWPWGASGWWSLSSLLLCLIMVVFVVIMCLRNRPVIGATAIPLRNMGGFAFVLQHYTPNNVTMLQNNMTISALGMSLNNSNHTDSIFNNYFNQSWSHLVYMILACSIIMYICSMHIISKIRQLVMRQLISLEKYTENSNGKHNPGEIKVIGFFLYQFSRPCSKSAVTLEIPCQIGTIPLNLDDWYLKPDPDISDWIVFNITKRWQRNVLFRLKWGPVCLLNRQYPNLESCQDMPNKVTLNMTEILSAYAHRLPTFWFSIRIIGCTKILLEQNRRVKELYNYYNHQILE